MGQVGYLNLSGITIPGVYIDLNLGNKDYTEESHSGTKLPPQRLLCVTKTGKSVVKSGNEFRHFFSELGGRLSCFLFKDRGEIGFFVVTQFISDFGDGLTGMHKQIFRLDEFAGLDDLADAFLKNIPADQVQVAGGHKQFGSVKFDPFRPAIVILQYLQEVFKGDILRIPCHGFIVRTFPAFRFDHSEEGIQNVFDDRDRRYTKPAPRNFRLSQSRFG